MEVRFSVLWSGGSFLPTLEGGLVARLVDNWRGGADQSTEHVLTYVITFDITMLLDETERNEKKFSP